MIHPPPVALIDHVHAEKTLSSQRTDMFWAKEGESGNLSSAEMSLYRPSNDPCIRTSQLLLSQ